MKLRQWCWRLFFYVLSLLVLALGITLNTKTGLGVSPIISVSYSISEIFALNFGNVTMGLYVIFVVVELVIRGRNRRWKDLLQVPLALVFTRFLNLFSACLPIHFKSLWENLLLLIVAVILTGIGAAMSVNMQLIPNPGDGIVEAIADTIHKSMGFTKNLFDLLNITITFALGIVFGHFLLGIGLGTVIAVLGVGRAVALFNHFCKEPMARLAGLSEA